MIIRTFKNTDTPAIIALWESCGLVVPWNDPAKDIQRKQTVGLDLFLVGELKGKIIAAAMGGYDGHRGWVNYLAVEPSRQKKGYARQLMQELEARLVDKGCPKINLMVRGSNVDVVQFYEALGYLKEDIVGLGKRLIPDH